jgi:hypothetical protein
MLRFPIGRLILKDVVSLSVDEVASTTDVRVSLVLRDAWNARIQPSETGTIQLPVITREVDAAVTTQHDGIFPKNSLRLALLPELRVGAQVQCIMHEDGTAQPVCVIPTQDSISAGAFSTASPIHDTTDALDQLRSLESDIRDLKLRLQEASMTSEGADPVEVRRKVPRARRAKSHTPSKKRFTEEEQANIEESVRCGLEALAKASSSMSPMETH